MYLRDVAARLLALSGVTSFTPDNSGSAKLKRGVVTGDLDALGVCITAGMQEILDVGPASLSERDDGALLQAPTVVTAAVTNGSAVVTLTGYVSWMAGCTIRIAGDAYDNELLSATLLARPCMAPTGSASATVYGDVIQLASTIKNVLQPVSIPSFPALYPCGSREEFDQFPLGNARQGFRARTTFSSANGYGSGDSGSGGMIWQQRQVGIPRAYFVESRYDSSLAYVPIYLRLSPMPAGQTPIRYRVKLKAPIFTGAQIDDGSGNNPGNVSIPQDMIEMGLVSFASQRWMSQPSVVLSDRQAAEISRQYQAALQALRGMRPMIATTTAVYE